MANTQRRSVRVPDDEWHAFCAAATANEESATQVLRALMRQYVEQQANKGAQQ